MVSHKKQTEYKDILTRYLKERNEDCLYQLYELSKVLLNEGVSLQDIFSLHIESLKNILQEVGIKLISFLDMDSLCQFIIDKSAEILKMEKGCLYIKYK